MSLVTFSFPAWAQSNLVVGGVRAAAGKNVVRAAVNPSLIVKPGHVATAVRLNPAASIPVQNQVIRATVHSVQTAQLSTQLPKMMATPTRFNSAQDERYAVRRYGNSGAGTGLSAWTMHREYTGPGLTDWSKQPAPQKPQTPAVKPEEPKFTGPSAEEIAAFHYWTKYGLDERVSPRFQGDPYEAARREELRAKRALQNGAPSSVGGTRLSGFALELQREADAPTRLLSPKDLQEFNTTIAVSREMSARPQQFPRRVTSARRQAEVMDDELNPFTVPPMPTLESLTNPRDPLAEAKTYPEFDAENYLGYKDYPLPFHPDVHELNVLVASDELGFAQHLQDGADPRVHITSFSSGDEAISELKAHPDKYHVVLTDMYMRQGNGVDVARYIQQNSLNCYPVVISKSSGNEGTLFLLGFDGSMSVLNEADAGRKIYAQMQQENPNLVLDGAGYEAVLRRMEETKPYQPTGKIFSYLSNLVANGGHAYPVH